MAPERAAAFAPGRVNLIGEHTDYNEGLALPFAIAEGVTVRAERVERPAVTVRAGGEEDSFELDAPGPAAGWRALVRGIVAELALETGARIQIEGGVQQGAGLSSSAALEVALCLVLLALAGSKAEPVEVARLCARVEQNWLGAETGLLDQLASLCGERDSALLIDFASLSSEPVPLRLGGWRLELLDSGERHELAASGYNERRAQCRRACELLGVRSLREAQHVDRLPPPLNARVQHVLDENARVLEAVAALRANDIAALGPLLSASHASLRDLYEVSTDAVERAVQRLLEAGAAGARLIGGGFGGSVLGLFAPGSKPPPGARAVQPAPGARLIA